MTTPRSCCTRAAAGVAGRRASRRRRGVLPPRLPSVRLGRIKIVSMAVRTFPLVKHAKLFFGSVASNWNNYSALRNSAPLAQDDTRSCEDVVWCPGQRAAAAALFYQFKAVVVTRCSGNARGDAQVRRPSGGESTGRQPLGSHRAGAGLVPRGRKSPTRYAPCAIRRFPRQPNARCGRRGRPRGST